MASTALLDAVESVLPAGEPGLALRDVAALVTGWGYEAVRAAARGLVQEERAVASGGRSHLRYRRAAGGPSDHAAELDADEACGEIAPRPLADAPNLPNINVGPALAFLARRGFQHNRHV